MPNAHKNNTVSFRPSEWERVNIEERAALSGMSKKDFITHSCIYSNICVVGTKNNIQKIVDAVEEMKNVVKEIANRETTGDFLLSDESMREISMRFTAMCLTLVDILDGASYLFGVSKPESASALGKEERLQQLLETLEFKYQDGDV